MREHEQGRGGAGSWLRGWGREDGEEDRDWDCDVAADAALVAVPSISHSLPVCAAACDGN
jgi:hypothetical protein